MLTIEDVVSAQKTNAHQGFELASHQLAYGQALLALNVRASKTALTATSRYAQALLDIKQPQDYWQLHAGLVQPLVEQGQAYGQEAQQATTTLTAQWGQWLQTRTAHAQQGFQKAVQSQFEHVPAGSQAAGSALKNWVATASTAVEAWQKAAQHVTQLTQTHIETLSKTAANTNAANASTKATA